MSQTDIRFKGLFEAWLVDSSGNETWREKFPNMVVSVGKNFLLDVALGETDYSVTGPYAGLISNTNFKELSASDTMSEHPGWIEAGADNSPKYTGPRKLAKWKAASGGSKGLATPLNFSFTSGGSVAGCFFVFGPKASDTIGSIDGVLLCAATFAAGPRTIVAGDTLNVTYAISL